MMTRKDEGMVELPTAPVIMRPLEAMGEDSPERSCPTKGWHDADPLARHVWWGYERE